MQIFITTLTGQTTMLLVQPEDTVASVKAQFKDKQGTPVDQQRLIYGGSELVDEKTLQDYNIERDATLHLYGTDSKCQIGTACNYTMLQTEQQGGKKQGLHDRYYRNEVQRFLNSTPSKELNAHKAIYTAATARMFMFVKVNITELGVESTIEQLLHMDPPFHVNLHLSSLLDGKVQQFKAVMSYVLELVHTGNYIELQPPFCELKYGQLLSIIKSKTGHTSCLVQGQFFLWTAVPLLDQFQWFTDVVPAANAEFVQNIEREQMVTTQHGGDVVTRHNRLRDIFVEFCHQAHLSVRVEAGFGLSRVQRNTRPADVLVQDWVRGSPAAIDITVTSPLTPAMLRDASTSAGSAAYAAECRKHEANDTKCQELGWTCIPLAVETFGHWGKEAQAVFSCLASFIAIHRASPKSSVLNEMYSRLNMSLVRSVARAILVRGSAA
eukprot:Em0041g5a